MSQFEAINDFRNRMAAYYAVPVLSPEEERALIDAWRNDHNKAAREKIVTAYLRVCCSKAVEWADKSSCDPDDLFGEAQLAMTVAFDKFDPEKGPLATWLIYYINFKVREYVAKYSGPLPLLSKDVDGHLFSNWGKFNKIASPDNAYITTYERHKRIAALAAKHPSYKNTTAEDVAQFEAKLKSIGLSLDRPVSEDGDKGVSFADTLISDLPGPEDIMEDRDRENKIALVQRAVSTLDESAQEILRSRDLRDDGKKQEPLQTLGERFKVSAERVRQIELGALRQIRRTLIRDGYKPE